MVLVRYTNCYKIEVAYFQEDSVTKSEIELIIKFKFQINHKNKYF